MKTIYPWRAFPFASMGEATAQISLSLECDIQLRLGAQTSVAWVPAEQALSRHPLGQPVWLSPLSVIPCSQIRRRQWTALFSRGPGRQPYTVAEAAPRAWR